MNVAPRSSSLVVIDTRPTAREEAERRWAGQTPANRLHRRQQARRNRVVDVQLGSVFVASLIAAATMPSWWGPGLMIAAWVAPALTGAWLDTYRPIGHYRPGSHDLVIALQLDPQEGTV